MQYIKNYGLSQNLTMQSPYGLILLMEMNILETSIIKLELQLVLLTLSLAVDTILLVKIKKRELDTLKFIKILLKTFHWI